MTGTKGKVKIYVPIIDDGMGLVRSEWALPMIAAQSVWSKHTCTYAVLDELANWLLLDHE